MSQSLPRLEGLVDADAARRAGQAFQEAARRLFSGTPSLAQPVQARVERADAVGVAMALQLPQVGSAIEAAKLRQQALKASSAGKAARL